MNGRHKDYLPFQVFNKFAGGLEEVAQTFGYRVLPALWWGFALFYVDKTEREKGFS